MMRCAGVPLQKNIPLFIIRDHSPLTIFRSPLAKQRFGGCNFVTNVALNKTEAHILSLMIHFYACI